MAALKAIATLLFVIAVPLFLVASNVRWAVNEPRLYSYGFDKYNIVDRTGIEGEELRSAARQIRAYFNNGEEFLDLRVKVGGVERSLYSQRETLHMRDVKGLVQGTYRVQEGAGGYIVAYVLVGLLLARGAFVRRLAKSAFGGSALTIGLVVMVGLGSLVGFDRLFLAFHLVSFSNDLWQLDPRRDYLIRMFPQGFFFDATILIAVATVVEALALGGVSLLLLRRRQRAETTRAGP